MKEAWLRNAPPLRLHREAHWTTPTVRKLIGKKIATYGESDVITAITNYARVLASERHFFNYSWGVADFLNRGLDNFLPEAMPDTNYLISRKQEQREPEYPTMEEAERRMAERSARFEEIQEQNARIAAARAERDG